MNFATPRITVALPVFNAGATIKPAMRSILGQTFTDFELLVLDDGSCDQTASFVRAFDDPRIRLLSDDCNRGLSTRLNEAIQLARGEFFARMDGDDIAYPRRFERQLAFLRENPEIDLVGTRAIAFRNGGLSMGLFPWRATHVQICAKPWMGFYLPHPTWMGRIGWFRSHLYRVPDPARSEDQELLLRSYSQSRFACLPDVLLGYRQAPFNLPRSLSARLGVAGSQWRVHAAQRRYGLAVMGTATAVGKGFVDCFRVVPGLERLFSQPFGEPVPATEQTVWDALASSYGLSARSGEGQ
jgi:glycosyltransferase involved in cell wall biosynthesis